LIPQPPAASRSTMAACGEQSPLHEKVYARVRCNRPYGHLGRHQKIRAVDFAVLAEWEGYEYTIFPNPRAK